MSNPFDTKTQKPTDRALAETLGRTKRHWDEIVGHALRTHADLTTEWKFYGRKYGWTLKLQHKKRAVLYLAPREGTFSASMALRDPAIVALRGTKVPVEMIQEIERSKPYQEGRAARLDVTNLKHVAIVEALVRVKLTT